MAQLRGGAAFGRKSKEEAAQVERARYEAERNRVWAVFHRFLQPGESAQAFAEVRIVPGPMDFNPMPGGRPLWAFVTQARLAMFSTVETLIPSDPAEFPDSEVLEPDDSMYAIAPGPRTGVATLEFRADSDGLASLMGPRTWWVPLDFAEQFRVAVRTANPELLSETTRPMYAKKRKTGNAFLDEDMAGALDTGMGWYCERCSALLAL